MTLSHFLAVLRARWRLALVVLVTTLGAAVVAVLLMPRTYVATTALLVDVSRPDPVTGMSGGGNPSPTLLSTQVGVLRSDRVAREVVHRLGLASDPKLHADWLGTTGGRGDFQGWLAHALQKRTDILPERDTNVISIEAKAGTPEAAARIADTFAQVYMDVSAALRVEAGRQASAFFERRAVELRAELEQAQARLGAFERANGVVVSDAQVDGESTRLNDLSLQLSLAETAAAEAGGMRAYATQRGADQLPAAQELAGLRAPAVLVGVEADEAADEKHGQREIGIDREGGGMDETLHRHAPALASSAARSRVCAPA